MSELRPAPIGMHRANAFVARHHRHSAAVRACRFCIAAVDLDNRIHGVAIVGSPRARELDDKFTAEVLRVCTRGTPNACSLLYGAARRACWAIGYTRLVTYTLATEPGTSLRAAGFLPAARVRGRPWSSSGRDLGEPRVRAERPAVDRVRWEVVRG